MAASAFKAWVVCAPGLEAVLKQELKQLLGFNRRKFLSPLLTGKHTKSRKKKNTKDTASKGGAECWLSPEALAVVHTQSAVAESVRVRVGKPFRAKYWNELQKGVDQLPLAAFLNKQQPVHVRVSASNSRLRHTGGIEERVRKVLSSKFGRGTNVTTAATSQSDGNSVTDSSNTKVGSREPVTTTLYVQLLEDFCQISVDASGVGDRRLHARGFRTHVGRAPIRETLAAACWKATRQHMAELQSARRRISPTAPVHVWDPFCGSGTMLLEAYLHEIAAVGEAPVECSSETSPARGGGCCDHNDGESTSSSIVEVAHPPATAVFPPGMARLLEATGPSSPRGETYPWQRWPNPQLGGLLQQFVSRRRDVIDTLIDRVAGVQSPGSPTQLSKFSKFTASDLHKKEVKAARHNTMSLRGLFMDFVEAATVASPSKPEAEVAAVPLSGSSQEEEEEEEQNSANGTVGDRTDDVHDTGEVHSSDEWLTNIRRRIKQAFRRSFTFFEADCVEATVKFQREHPDDDSLPLVVFANLPYGQRSGLDKAAFQNFCVSLGLSSDRHTGVAEPSNVCDRASTELKPANSIPAAGVYVVTPLSAQQMKMFSGTTVPWSPVLQFRNGGVSVNLLAADISSADKVDVPA